MGDRGMQASRPCKRQEPLGFLEDRGTNVGLSPLDWIVHVGIVGSFALLMLYAVVAANFGPENAPTWWFCPWKTIFGSPCPTCGITRSLAAAMRGDWRISLSLHPLCPIIVAFEVYMICACLKGIWRRRPTRLNPVAAGLFLFILLGCGIARNLVSC